jgi:hypothetical protein
MRQSAIAWHQMSTGQALESWTVAENLGFTRVISAAVFDAPNPDEFGSSDAVGSHPEGETPGELQLAPGSAGASPSRVAPASTSGNRLAPRRHGIGVQSIPSFRQASAGLSPDRLRAILIERPMSSEADLQASPLHLDSARTNPKSFSGGFAGSGRSAEIGANEPKVHLWRICGHATRARNRRERTQSPSIPGLRARAVQRKSARTNPISICAGFAGSGPSVEIGANEPKVHLCRTCGHAAQTRRRRERSMIAEGGPRCEATTVGHHLSLS